MESRRDTQQMGLGVAYWRYYVTQQPLVILGPGGQYNRDIDGTAIEMRRDAVDPAHYPGTALARDLHDVIRLVYTEAGITPTGSARLAADIAAAQAPPGHDDSIAMLEAIAADLRAAAADLADVRRSLFGGDGDSTDSARACGRDGG
jgi:hypothetical protein